MAQNFVGDDLFKYNSSLLLYFQSAPSVRTYETYKLKNLYFKNNFEFTKQ